VNDEEVLASLLYNIIFISTCKATASLLYNISAGKAKEGRKIFRDSSLGTWLLLVVMTLTLGKACSRLSLRLLLALQFASDERSKILHDFEDHLLRDDTISLKLSRASNPYILCLLEH